MKEPPVATFEKSSDEHGVVSFANMAFIMRCLTLLLVVDRQFFLTSSHVVQCILVKRLLEDSTCNIFFRLEFIFGIEHLAQV